jgi:hypothetical protein
MKSASSLADVPTGPEPQALLSPSDTDYPFHLPVSTVDSKDNGTPDAWVPRHPELVRLTGRHPFNCEPTLPGLMKHGFVTPVSLHYVRNHGAVPRYAHGCHAWNCDITLLFIYQKGLVFKVFPSPKGSVLPVSFSNCFDLAPTTDATCMASILLSNWSGLRRWPVLLMRRLLLAHPLIGVNPVSLIYL